MCSCKTTCFVLALFFITSASAQQSNSFWSVDAQFGYPVELGFLKKESSIRFHQQEPYKVRGSLVDLGVSRYKSIYKGLGFNAGIHISYIRYVREHLDQRQFVQNPRGVGRNFSSDVIVTSNELRLSIPLQLHYCFKIKGSKWFVGAGFLTRTPGWGENYVEHSNTRLDDSHDPWNWDNHFQLAHLLFSVSSRFKLNEHVVGLSLNINGPFPSPVAQYQDHYISFGMHYTL